MNFGKSIKLSGVCTELQAPLIFTSKEDAQAKLSALAVYLSAEGFKPVSIELFGPFVFASAVEKFKEKMSINDIPFIHILPLDENAAPLLSGCHIIAIKGADIEYKKSAKGSIAAVYATEDAQFCRISGVNIPEDTRDSLRYTLENLTELDDALKICGFEFSDIVRTWFYNRDILSWYDSFNAGRTKFFREHNIFEGLLPASTGIGGPNAKSTRIESGVLAVKGAAKAGNVFEIPSPLQCGATNYGSSFSRAVEMDYAKYRRVIVSGTASIDPSGNTLYYGEIEAQVELTMQVVEGILKSRGMEFKDTHRAIVYCMNPKYYAAFKKWMDIRGEIPHIPAYNTVCRGDLMFEVELDAAVEK